MHKLAALCVRRPVFATMLILSLTVIGTFAYFSLGVDLLPKVDVPTVSITTVNPGATAEEIETEITKRIEDAVNTISQIDELRSTSVQGLSTVIVSFSLDKNGDIAAQEIRDKVNQTLPDLPETAESPVIVKRDPDADPPLARRRPRPVSGRRRPSVARQPDRRGHRAKNPHGERGDRRLA